VEIVQRFIVSTKQRISELQLRLQTDLVIYNEELERVREKHMKEMDSACQQFIEYADSPPVTEHAGFIVEAVRPAYRGVQVWPSLAVILPIAGLIGTLLGLAFGGLVSLAFKAS